MSEIRQNRLTGESVVIAPERAKRGTNLARPAAPSAAVPAQDAACPFCAGNEAVTGPETYRADGEDGQWAVRSCVNKYSVLSPEGEVGAVEDAEHTRAAVNGVGLHEVVVESPRHDLPMALLPAAQVRRIVEAYVARFRAFYADRRVRHVIIFKNHGAEAGASQQHPHSQIVGIPIMPGQVLERVAHAREFYASTGRCLACSMIAEEQAEGSRIVAENAAFIAFVPYAALSPYHLWIFPKVHAACFSEVPVETETALAELLHLVLERIYGLLGNPPFNLVVRSLGPREKDAAHFHWYIAIVPRVNRTAGFELGTGMYINPMLPEAAAQALREFRG
ncbi:MAG: galactose-1-phosphate uridylyltransferase [Chthoniobacter sp.]|uniref:galactose-1-phosphate uridylyltransferase n=1 Tax=Chthoniobacter sp. TaxID=2510640 RepID=UPI0032ACF2B8